MQGNLFLWSPPDSVYIWRLKFHSGKWKLKIVKEHIMSFGLPMRLVACGSFTPPDTETKNKTNTNKMCSQPKRNLLQTLSLCSMNTHIQFHRSLFYRPVSRCLVV